MRTPVLGGGLYVPDAASTTYNPLHGQLDWAAVALRYQVVPCAGKFSDLYVVTQGDPGAGKSRTLSLYVNGATSALTATIGSGTISAEDTTHEVSVSAGDLVAMEHVPAGTPSVQAVQWVVLFTPTTTGQSIVLGCTSPDFLGELNSGATEYASIACGGVRLNNVDIWRQPIPTGGKFSHAQLDLSAAPDPGGSDGYRFTLQVNGLDSALVVSITGDNTTGSATTDVSISAGDTCQWKIEPIGTPAAEPNARWGLVWVPTTSGEAIVLGQTYDEPHTTNTEENILTHWAIAPWATFGGTNRAREAPVWEATLRKLYLWLTVAPGAGKSYDFTIYKRTPPAPGGADTTLTVHIADTATTGNDPTHEVSLADYDMLRMKSDPTNTPALTRANWGMVMELPGLQPTVATNPATDITHNSATLNGQITDDGGEACDKRGFVYDTSPRGDPGDTAPADSEYADYIEETDSFEIGAFTGALTSLARKTPYYVRAYAHNSAGYSYGDEVSFTTLAAIPTVSTNAATSVEATTATLNGTLEDDGGEACDVRFQYGETSDYGIDTEWQSGKESVVAFEQAITGLDTNKTYHFRAQARNSAGTANGADRTFKTPIELPTVTTNPASGLSAIAATLNGTLSDNGGEACECGFEWGLDTGYGVTTPTQGKTTGESFSQVIRGLFPDTTYHFRAFATNSKGTGYGGDVTFTTNPVMSRAFALAREEL